MSLIVQKFGGTSVADTHHLFNVARKVLSFYKKGNDVIVVVSAQGDTTDKLIQAAKGVNPNASKREMDALLSTGEQISASLLAMALEKLGAKAISLTGWQAGIKTDLSYSNASISEILTERIKVELKKNNIVIVTGFQGVNPENNITTLGRGGSDTSAVALAGAMRADVCKIYTDVDGVYTADPRIVPAAKKLSLLSYEEMFILSHLGSQVLSDTSIETAEKYKVEVEVLSSMLPDSKGTIIKSIPKSKITSISGIAIEKDMVKIIIQGLKNKLELERNITSKLLSLKLIKDAELKPTKQKLNSCFLVPNSNLEDTIAILKELIPENENMEIFYEKDKVKISVVNLATSFNINIASIIFESLHELNINIEMTACDETRVSIVVKAENLYRAVNEIHTSLFDEDYLA